MFEEFVCLKNLLCREVFERVRFIEECFKSLFYRGVFEEFVYLENSLCRIVF